MNAYVPIVRLRGAWSTPLYYSSSLFVCSIILCLMSESANAQGVGLTTPRVAAMGHAGIGGARANSALILNPAGMSAGASYAVDANYFRTSEGANLLGINVVDSQTRYSRDRLALGLGYQALMKSGEASGHDAQVGFSLPVSKLSSSLLLMGASARYIYDERTERDGFDLNAGLLLQLSSAVSVGAVGVELLEEDRRSLGGGLGLSTQRLSVNLDYLRQLSVSENHYRAGAELMLSDALVFRFGYLYRQRRDDELSVMSPNVNDLSLINESPSQQWSGGIALVGLGGGDGQLSTSYSYAPETKSYFFGLSLSTYLNMGINP